MNNFYARSVFFVRDADRASRFYVEQLGFASDWSYRDEDRTIVCQVSLFGAELILNETAERTQRRVGCGRIFIGLEDDQAEPFRRHVVERGIELQRVEWGRPTLVIRDLDENEIFFWLPGDNFKGFETAALESSSADVRPVR